MDVSEPHSIFTRVSVQILVRLDKTSKPLTGREIARLLQRSDQAVRLTLRGLVEHGLVNMQDAGSALLYTLNHDHVAAPAVRLMATMRQEFERRLREAITAWEVKPHHASLFGSTARGDGGVESDIDIFIVRPSTVDEDDFFWADQIDVLTRNVYRWTGNRASIAEVSEGEVGRLRHEQPPVVAALRAESIPLSGPPASELFRGGH